MIQPKSDHVVELVFDDVTKSVIMYSARCSCGWVSPRFFQRSVAQRVADEHEGEGRTA